MLLKAVSALPSPRLRQPRVVAAGSSRVQNANENRHWAVARQQRRASLLQTRATATQTSQDVLEDLYTGESFYDILGIPPTASQSQIKKAYLVIGCSERVTVHHRFEFSIATIQLCLCSVAPSGSWGAATSSVGTQKGAG